MTGGGQKRWKERLELKSEVLGLFGRRVEEFINFSLC